MMIQEGDLLTDPSHPEWEVRVTRVTKISCGLFIEANLTEEAIATTSFLSKHVRFLLPFEAPIIQQEKEDNSGWYLSQTKLPDGHILTDACLPRRESNTAQVYEEFWQKSPPVFSEQIKLPQGRRYDTTQQGRQ